MIPAALSQRSLGIWFFSLLAGIFGLLTIKSGGSVLFFDGEARQAAGHFVPFVLWFNFSAGFVYVIAGIALWLMRPWSAWLSLFLAAATLIIFAAFGLHILNGGEYETRTVMAMTLRSGVWIAIAAFAWQRLRGHQK
ncbi:MAG: hypothetical protein OQL06_03065 [Gammaproteobacteria bacterium]|nr:hypothetical protein [Gammaproteobacteria bacterium]